jgi:hypothetical protein
MVAVPGAFLAHSIVRFIQVRKGRGLLGVSAARTSLRGTLGPHFVRMMVAVEMHQDGDKLVMDQHKPPLPVSSTDSHEGGDA